MLVLYLMRKIILILNILLVLVILSLTVISIYLFYFNKGVSDIVTNEEVEVLRDDISNIEAELLTYDQITPNNDLINDLKPDYSIFSSLVARNSAKFLERVTLFSKNDIDEPIYYESVNINEIDSNVTHSLSDEYSSYFKNSLTIPLIFTDKELNPNVDVLNNLDLKDFSYSNDIEYIGVVEENFTVGEVTKLLKYIKEEFNKKSILILNPRYIDNSNEYDLIRDFDELNSVTDIFLIKTHPYTSLNSYLPGPITQRSNFIDIIQYYLFNLPKEKLKIMINNNIYVWPFREIETNIEFNYLDENPQATLFTLRTNLLNELPTILNTEDSDTFLNDEQNNTIVLTQSNEFIKLLEDIVLSFGITSIVYSY